MRYFNERAAKIILKAFGLGSSGDNTTAAIWLALKELFPPSSKWPYGLPRPFMATRQQLIDDISISIIAEIVGHPIEAKGKAKQGASSHRLARDLATCHDPQGVTFSRNKAGGFTIAYKINARPVTQTFTDASSLKSVVESFGNNSGALPIPPPPAWKSHLQPAWDSHPAFLSAVSLVDASTKRYRVLTANGLWLGFANDSTATQGAVAAVARFKQTAAATLSGVLTPTARENGLQRVYAVKPVEKDLSFEQFIARPWVRVMLGLTQNVVNTLDLQAEGNINSEESSLDGSEYQEDKPFEHREDFRLMIKQIFRELLVAKGCLKDREAALLRKGDLLVAKGVLTPDQVTPLHTSNLVKNHHSRSHKLDKFDIKAYASAKKNEEILIQRNFRTPKNGKENIKYLLRLLRSEVITPAHFMLGVSIVAWPVQGSIATAMKTETLQSAVSSMVARARQCNKGPTNTKAAITTLLLELPRRISSLLTHFPGTPGQRSVQADVANFMTIVYGAADVEYRVERLPDSIRYVLDPNPPKLPGELPMARAKLRRDLADTAKVAALWQIVQTLADRGKWALTFYVSGISEVAEDGSDGSGQFHPRPEHSPVLDLSQIEGDGYSEIWAEDRPWVDSDIETMVKASYRKVLEKPRRSGEEMLGWIKRLLEDAR